MYQEQANGIGAGMLAGKVYGNTIPDTPPTPGFMAVLENLGGTEACVRDLCESARMAAERLLGHAPSSRPQTNSKDGTIPAGLVGGMNDQLQRIKVLLTDLRDDLNAINAALP